MKKTLALILALAMVFALAVPVLSKPDPKPGNPMWDDAYKGMGAPVDPSVSAMSDASGDKITSNAHSGDVDGIYFYWDDNNKSVLDATLLVADFFFDFIKGEVGERSFTVTAKNSNAYWDYEIVEGAGFVLAGADGVSAYKIPRFFMYAQTDKKTGAVVLDKKTGLPVMVKDELKNINMIFISGDWIDVELEIEKVWLDEDGAVFAGDDSIVTFNSPFVLGKQILSTKSIFGTTFSVRENPIDGYRTHESIQSIKLKPGESGKLTFVNQKKWANINIEKVWLAECDCEEDCELAPADLYDGYHIVAAPEDAEAEFEINGEAAALGNNKVKAGDYVVCELDGLLGDYGWELYSDNDIAVSIGLGESYTVVFYNLYSVATPVDDPVIFVDKIWTGAGAADIAELDSYVTITDSYGNTYALRFSDGVEVPEGEITISEAVVNISGYTITCAGINVAAYDNLGDVAVSFAANLPGGSVTFVAEVDLSYEITFTNNVTKNKVVVPVGERIESESHADKFWGYGIIGIGANTTSTSGNDYAIAFVEDFFDTYEEVTFRYGSSSFSSDDVYLTFTAANLAGAVKEYVKFENKDLANGALDCGILDILYFPNVWGQGGGMHIYLHELVLN